MTFTDVLIAIAIFTLFIIGLSQIFFPAMIAWNKASNEYRTAQSINFIAKSFRNACSGSGGSLDNWKKAVTAVRELESYEINEIWQGGALRALKLTCIVSNEHVEVIGLCIP
jgi:hypothetical protein